MAVIQLDKWFEQVDLPKISNKQLVEHLHEQAVMLRKEAERQSYYQSRALSSYATMLLSFAAKKIGTF